MICRNCSKDAFLFRGLCKECAPALFADYETANQFMDSVFDAYKKETGKEPLQDWYDFELFLEKQKEISPAIERLYPS